MIERTADDLEMAGALQEHYNAEGRARSERALAPETHPDFDGVHCVEADCGVELPAVRLAYKRIRCTPCATAAEHRAKLAGRR
jgi:hypothetical protein